MYWVTDAHDHTQAHIHWVFPLDERSAQRRDLHLTTHNTPQETDIHNPCGIRTLNLSKLVTPDLRPKQRDYQDRHHLIPIRKHLSSIPGKHDIKE